MAPSPSSVIRLAGRSLSTLGARSISSTSPTMATNHSITIDKMNPNVKTMQYAVRGPIVIRAVELEKELKAGASKPFTSVVKANIGDAHAMGQQPITFIRQVMACVAYPQLMRSENMPADVKGRAEALLGACGGGSVGAYTMSHGIELIRQHAAEYIQRRDGGVASDKDNIVLSGGASESIRNLLKLFIDNTAKKPAGVMIPTPQYPLYSATTAEFGLHQVSYYLDEASNWGLSAAELQRALDASREHCEPRIICIINPGNPTGQVLSRANIEEIIKFAHKNQLFIFADEVYQENVYAEGCAFHSFKKVLMEMGAPYSSLELASFMSVSKGYVGECGQRGGYAEILNLHPDVMAMFKKSISAKLCSTVMGQVVMDCVVKPPVEGDDSYPLFNKERTAVLDSLKERAKSLEVTLSAIDGVHCNPVQGAMYAFPKVDLPAAAIAAAAAKGVEPDFFYALALLESTGVCVVPGSGFGQAPGTYHFRTTILPQPALMKDMLSRFKGFHEKFLKEYA